MLSRGLDTAISRRLHGRRGLKFFDVGNVVFVYYGRRLHGRRGLKYSTTVGHERLAASPPSRAAWIEMLIALRLPQVLDRRRLHGRRGLKYTVWEFQSLLSGRRLHGRRGLKWQFSKV